MNNKLSNILSITGNISQLIIASSILCDLYLRFRTKKAAPVNISDDDTDDSPSPSTTPLTNAT